MTKKGKFFVGIDFRKNELSSAKTNLIVEVHSTEENIKLYNNIHYPDAFAKKIFKNNNKVTHVIVRNAVDNSEYTINNTHEN